MGHRQQMNASQRADWDAMQYKKRLEANKGFNFAYMTDELDEHLNKMQYECHLFDVRGRKEDSTRSILLAKEVAENYRNNGYYARVICIKNDLKIKELTVWYKKRNNGKN